MQLEHAVETEDEVQTEDVAIAVEVIRVLVAAVAVTSFQIRYLTNQIPTNHLLYLYTPPYHMYYTSLSVSFLSFYLSNISVQVPFY